MIEQTKSYKTSDGEVHATIEAAKVAELRLKLDGLLQGDASSYDPDELLKHLVENSEEFAAILSSKSRKPRTPKPAAAKKTGKKTEPAAA